MSAVSDTNIAERLEVAWQQLVGSKLAFHEHSLDYAEHGGDLHAVIPVHIPSAHATSGVALRVSKKVATELAANLFGIDPASVDDGQRIDVCAELCNILCSCVTPLFADNDELELGVPRNVDFAEFQKILSRNEIGSLYEAAPGEGNVTVVVVNSFDTAAPHAPEVVSPTLPENVVEARNSMKFLIVDDSRAIQTIVRRAVEKAGLPNLELRAASTGEEALKIATEWHPDLIITDWHMPGMSGMELLQHLKVEHAEIKVGFVTTEASSKKLDEARESGAQFVIRKPFKDEELIEAVLAVIGKQTEGTVSSVAVDTLTRFFSTTLNQTLNLALAPSCPLDDIQAPWAIGLYAIDGKNDVRGFCLLDWAAVVFVGSTLASMAGDNVTGSMASPAVAQKLYEHAAAVLSEGASTMFVAPTGQRIVLARSQLVQSPPEKLKEIMQKSRGRSDFTLEQAGIPLGRITLITR